MSLSQVVNEKQITITIPAATHTKPQYWVEISSSYAKPFDGLIRPTRASSSSVVARQLRGMLQQCDSVKQPEFSTKTLEWRAREMGEEGSRREESHPGKAKLAQRRDQSRGAEEARNRGTRLHDKRKAAVRLSEFERGKRG
ncbi:hypothetical protein GX51_05603 [Blastomyces parvus]|uniref:Uncharacterized protein n=1 Tax=Blastomyces parvus TaxID=2060905 RepID=A0A2B7WVJ4_9EURO|nr:hypothetical protein GX51_05603 [Blastomyces parvus]